jgi:hypothetical protein
MEAVFLWDCAPLRLVNLDGKAGARPRRVPVGALYGLEREDGRAKCKRIFYVGEDTGKGRKVGRFSPGD